MTQPSSSGVSAMRPRLALAAVLPPWARWPALGVVDGCDERVEQARVVAPAVERTQALEQLLAVVAAQLVDRRDAQPFELARDGGADVGNRLQVFGRHGAHHAAGRRRRLVGNGRPTGQCSSADGATPASARQSLAKWAWSA